MTEHRATGRSNKLREDRIRTRARCRAVLADHIRDRTRISIEPKQVRLINTEKEGYKWRICVAEMKPLFCKGLSNTGVRDQRRLIEQVGRGFEAIPATQNYITFQAHANTALSPETKNSESYIIDPALLDSASSSSSTTDEDEIRALKLELQNTNLQHESMLQQLQECTGQLQLAIQMKEYYEFCLLRVFASLNDMGHMLDGIRGESARVLTSHGEASQIQDSPTTLES
ncbi:hypothetical protein FOXG_12482 [Fusarium oxysporum f. sp. lycopersici 4287]|uniref:Uncharacterized protein n=1 Tax=Fusarium oxysporum f. sp. lycopersici (strain 4287 / CBS 123668 / FGSC 9935 / NRRL 34936) TaxID=426428 RepID=A0A0J9VSR1_FUSO4|nr:hypothetical protein FOXG_12482 [Fusarium oxysporum f. sp. lycopersici 4287]EWZ79212.1 hypothetical protein FOWG_16656 [Fusarium oxysporum f. sp. lycopersici MN25]KNB13796.1 hypothetical protein FOXG_12482 [Fusarium oxysporum f. sp. lycopersici 4287]